MTEIIFIVETAPEGGFTARALGAAVFTEGDTERELAENVREAVACHFEGHERPKVIRLHYVREQLIAG